MSREMMRALPQARKPISEVQEQIMEPLKVHELLNDPFKVHYWSPNTSILLSRHDSDIVS